MQRFAEFAPTMLDPQGAFIENREDWLVVPVMDQRNASAQQSRRFASVLRQLGGESTDVEVYRLGHWLIGWFEILLVRPGTPAETKALRIEARQRGDDA
jgi:hypothetical protein